MQLRHKIILIVSLVVVSYAAIDHTIQRSTVMPSFAELESVEARTNMDRVVQAIQNEIDQVDELCRARASWDETYAFVSAESPAERARYERSNLGRSSFANARIDLLYVCSPDGTVVWGEVRDWREDRALSLRQMPSKQLSAGHAYLVSQNVPRGFEADAQRGYISGLVQTEHGPMLLASRPILTSEGEGPIRGTVILGRFLNDALVSDLGLRTSVKIALWPLDSPEIPPEEGAVLADVTSSAEPVLVERGKEVLDVYTTVADMRRAPALLVRARLPRSIMMRGANAVRYAFLSTMASGLLLLLVLLAVLQTTVLAPIGKLTRHALYIGQTEDATVKLEFAEGRQDEIGVLSREFDSMLQKLAKSRATVVETARRAGMSEIANGILHNVGNVLNSVNVSAGMLAERVRGSKVTRLEKLTGLAEKHADDLGDFLTKDPKGKHFRPYLSELTRLMRSDQKEMEQEMASLSDGIEHIRALVSSQQAHAGKSGLREPTDLVSSVDKALQVSREATTDSPDVEVVCDYAPDLPGARLDRHKLMEILVNVIKNAREALAEVESERRIVVAMTTSRSQTGGEVVMITVSDNGPGIDPVNLTKVFNHGFTTKPNGCGFGLHASANAATEMGGSLKAHSPGSEGGATFVLEFPFEPVASPAAAAGRV